jgi:phosphoribosylformylglycinamidine synthase
MCFGGSMGVDLNIHSEERPDFFLFNETAGTFIVEVESPDKAEALFGNVPYRVLGKTRAGNGIRVTYQEKELFTTNVNDLKDAWQAPMKALFH